MDTAATPAALGDAAGLVLLTEGGGATRWAFREAPAVRVVATRCGLGLVAGRAFACGDVVLVDRWLVGLSVGQYNACEHCLRACAWSPVDTSCPGCSARYCSTACRDAAWRQQHRLLCTAAASPEASGTHHPLAVYAKHARLAPAVLQQKPEEVLLAARMLAACVLWEGAGEPGAARSAVPPPFDRLSSYCVVGAARKNGRPTDAFAARSKWLGDSYRLLAASALGRHPRFASRCPPTVYSHCLGMIDRNAASTCSVSASELHAARAGAGAAAPPPRAAAGLGLYPLFSFANHSCSPNTVNAKGMGDADAALDNSLVLRAARRIEAGEEVAFDYLDLAHELRAARVAGSAPSDGERRARLLEHFGFSCACTACARR